MPSQFHGGNDPFPVGAIIPWWGDPEDIPYGWSYCDGTDGTPDLRNRFPRGVPDSATDPGATGGQTSVDLDIQRMPPHSHDGLTGFGGSHHHYLNEYNHADIRAWDSSLQGLTNEDEVDSTANGSHSHSGELDPAGDGSTTMPNRPRFVEMSFIQKQPLE